MQTKEQRRSAFALEQISVMFKDQVDEKTANFIVGVPTMILSNGLAQSMAFLLSKKKDQKCMDTFKIVRFWLEREIPSLKHSSEMGFLKSFAGLQQSEYLKAQQESLAMLQWLKRYVRAFENEESQR
jgi:CRISPR-associated protein Cmr5